MIRSVADRATVALCGTQLVSWGVLFYAFPVLRVEVVAETGWSDLTVSAAFTAGLLVWALASLPAGGLLDRFGPRWVMAGGAALGPVGVVIVATAPSAWVFTAGWLCVGVAMSAVLYSPAFATVARLHDANGRVRALVLVTLAGGLASTVFAPLTALLSDRLGWRGALLVLAALLLAAGGVSQVAGRLADAPLARRVRRRSREALVLGVVVVSTAAFAAADHLALVVVVAVGAGAARGLMTLVQATAVVDRWGTRDVGRLTGALAAPVTLAMAMSPWAQAHLAALLDGHGPSFLVLAGLALVGVVLVWLSGSDAVDGAAAAAAAELEPAPRGGADEQHGADHQQPEQALEQHPEQGDDEPGDEQDDDQRLHAFSLARGDDRSPPGR